MNRKFREDAKIDLAAYEPVNSEFRERAYMDWRVEGKGINMYGLQWKYVLLSIDEEEGRGR